MGRISMPDFGNLCGSIVNKSRHIDGDSPTDSIYGFRFDFYILFVRFH